MYQRPLEHVIHNTEKNFLFREFKQHIAAIAIEIKEVLVEAYNSISKVERYYILLH